MTVNGTRLYFDVDGPALVPDGPRMREKPTVVMVHGGPGADHSHYKPAFSALSDVAQVIYYDHRGNGRSSGDDPATWNLAQWGEDLKGLCDALGVENPIVIGASFGGFVTQSYATRHPEHASKLILISTAPKVDFDAIHAAFDRIGGPEARAVAQAYWDNPTDDTRAEYARVCAPFYTVNRNTDWLSRALMRNETALHFNGPKNEQGRMDFRDALHRVTCPVLVLAGEDDPIMPMAFSETLVHHLPDERVTFRRYETCGHGVIGDRPDAMDDIRTFIEGTP